MLSDASPFFNAACKPAWLKDDTLLLPDDDPRGTFSIGQTYQAMFPVFWDIERAELTIVPFLLVSSLQAERDALTSILPIAVRVMAYWIYQNQLGLPAKLFRPESVNPVKGDNTMEAGPGLLAKLFVLAQKYQMEA